MSESYGGKSSRTGHGGHKRRRRRRTILNLGTPFAQVDDFIVQSEDAVKLGYRVLEEVVNEIKAGYHVAKEYNNLHRKYEDGEIDPATGEPFEEPAIPWQEMVRRLQSLQDITLQAMRDSTNILLDSTKSSMKAVHDAAQTVAQSRDDVDKKPKMAGPVFPDPICIDATIGGPPSVVDKKIRHVGLSRLRIEAYVDPLQKLNVPEGRPGDMLSIAEVSFVPSTLPDEKDVSILHIDVGDVPAYQEPGVYEGLIIASNFELLIAVLRVTVKGLAAEARPEPATQTLS